MSVMGEMFSIHCFLIFNRFDVESIRSCALTIEFNEYVMGDLYL